MVALGKGWCLPDDVGFARCFVARGFFRLQSIRNRIVGLTLFSVLRGRHPDVLTKYPVELREAIKATRLSHLCNWHFGIQEQRLHISDPGHLDVVGHAEAGSLLKFVGKIAGTDAKVP